MQGLRVLRGFSEIIPLIWVLFSVPLTLLGLEIVYHGWKEQEKKAEEKV